MSYLFYTHGGYGDDVMYVAILEPMTGAYNDRDAYFRLFKVRG
jgi:hypothetical protein